MTLAVSVRGLAMQYGRRLVFQELSFDLAAGQAAGVVGPNGSGKTTLLRALAGCLTPRSGEIRINGLTPRDALARTGVGSGGTDRAVYRGTAPSSRPWSHFVPRIVPHHPAAHVPIEAPFIAWADPRAVRLADGPL